MGAQYADCSATSAAIKQQASISENPFSISLFNLFETEEQLLPSIAAKADKFMGWPWTMRTRLSLLLAFC